MIFSKHNGIPLEINYKKKTAKTPKHMDTKQYDTNNQWVTEELKEETKKNTWRKKKTKTQQFKNLQDAGKAVL